MSQTDNFGIRPEGGGANRAATVAEVAEGVTAVVFSEGAVEAAYDAADALDRKLNRGPYEPYDYWGGHDDDEY